MDLPRPGPKEVIEELPSSTDYYDGSLNLNSVKIQCTVYQNQNDCLHQNKCGWCGETSSCILGNNLGPLQPCNKLSYVYTYHPPEEMSKNATVRATQEIYGSQWWHLDKHQKV